MKKIFPGQNLCSGAFGGNNHPYTKQRARHGAHFWNPPPPPPLPGAHAIPPPCQAIFGPPYRPALGLLQCAASHPSISQQLAGGLIKGLNPPPPPCTPLPSTGGLGPRDDSLDGLDPPENQRMGSTPLYREFPSTHRGDVSPLLYATPPPPLEGGGEASRQGGLL